MCCGVLFCGQQCYECASSVMAWLATGGLPLLPGLQCSATACFVTTDSDSGQPSGWSELLWPEGVQGAVRKVSPRPSVSLIGQSGFSLRTWRARTLTTDRTRYLQQASYGLLISCCYYSKPTATTCCSAEARRGSQ